MLVTAAELWDFPTGNLAQGVCLWQSRGGGDHFLGYKQTKQTLFKSSALSHLMKTI